jgi:large repetitive protein
MKTCYQRLAIFRNLRPLIGITILLAQLSANKITAAPETSLPSSLPKNEVIATVKVGTGPIQLAVSPNSDVVYVANYSSGTISAINTKNNNNRVTLKFAKTGDAPHDLAVMPDGSFLYVANEGSNTVSVLAASNGALVQTVFGCLQPEGLAISPDGAQVYVTSETDTMTNGTVCVINTATNQMESPAIPVGGGPMTVTFAPDGNCAWVTNSSRTGYLSCIDTASQTVLCTSGGKIFYPEAVSVCPDGEKGYVTESNYVAVTGSNLTTVKRTILVDPQTGNGLDFTESLGRAAITPNGKYLYVPITNFNNAPSNLVVVVSTETETVVGRPIIVGSQPYAVAVAPNGAYAYVANFGDDTVSVIDLGTK